MRASLYKAAPSAAQLLQQTQLAKVDFGKLSWRAFDPPHRADVLAELTVLAREPVQRWIWHHQTLAAQEFVNLGQNEPVFSQLGLNLWLPRQQGLFDRKRPEFAVLT